MLNEILIALRSVATNAYLLNEQRRTRKRNNFRELLEGNVFSYQGNEDQRSVIAIVVDLLLAGVKNYLVFNLLQQVLEELLPYSSLDDYLLQPALSKLIVNYYEKKVHAS